MYNLKKSYELCDSWILKRNLNFNLCTWFSCKEMTTAQKEIYIQIRNIYYVSVKFYRLGRLEIWVQGVNTMT